MTLSIHSQIKANKSKTWIIIGLFISFIATIAYVISKASGFNISFFGIALIMSGLFSLGSFYYGDKIVLSMSGAKKADENKDSELFTIINRIAETASLPVPKLYIIEDQSLNAFATGRDPQHAVICVTRGLVERLDKLELKAVLAHELSHIQNYDTRLMAIVSVLVGFVVYLSDIFLRSLWFGGVKDREERNGTTVVYIFGMILAFVTPIMATLIQLAISRRREFLADASGALLTRNPQALALALEKIGNDKHVLNKATNATAHLFISNPFKVKNKAIRFSNLFNTHPPLEERIKILRLM